MQIIFILVKKDFLNNEMINNAEPFFSEHWDTTTKVDAFSAICEVLCCKQKNKLGH